MKLYRIKLYRAPDPGKRKWWCSAFILMAESADAAVAEVQSEEPYSWARASWATVIEVDGIVQLMGATVDGPPGDAQAGRRPAGSIAGTRSF